MAWGRLRYPGSVFRWGRGLALLSLASDETCIRLGCYVGEETVTYGRQSPWVSPKLLSDSFHEEFLQLGHASPLPELVRKRDDEFLDTIRRISPLCMGATHSSHLRACTVVEQETFPGRLMLVSGLLKLIAAHDFADIVKPCAHANESLIDNDADTPKPGQQ